jgi:TrpR-related protein YerC/YecD
MNSGKSRLSEDENMFTPKFRNDQTDLLMKALLSLQNAEEAYRFCEDVLTMQELKSIAQRLEVAVMLRKKVTYQEIAKMTGASTATISRVNRCLLYGTDGYHILLDRLQDEEGIPTK